MAARGTHTPGEPDDDAIFNLRLLRGSYCGHGRLCTALMARHVFCLLRCLPRAQPSVWDWERGIAVWGSGLVAWRFGGSCMGLALVGLGSGIDRGRDEDHAGFKLYGLFMMRK